MSTMLRNFMPAKVRSNAGCWTCRLRRKKCDEQRPVCDACQALEITCHFEDEKPAWMDGGPLQKEMADNIKAQVKKQASQRRDRKYMELLESGTRGVQLGPNDEPISQPPPPRQGLSFKSSTSHLRSKISSSHLRLSNAHRRMMNGGGMREPSMPPAPHSDSDPNSQSSGAENGFTPPSSHTSGASPPGDAAWSSPIIERKLANDDGGPDVDVHFIMMYLDYVFPYLFPFYRPPVLSGGRGWILDILQCNKSVYYTAISLAAYFFGIVLANGDKSHTECTDRMARKLQTQLELGLRELQKEMRQINSSQTGFNMTEGLIVMQAIVQMVVFEVATSNGDNWKVHLDAAIALFFQVLPKAEDWIETLHGLYTPRWPPPSMGIRRPWSTNQAALRFYTANLVNMDVMSAVSLERPPRLRAYQDTIIPAWFSNECRENAQTAGPLFMEEFTGLHNWIVQMIGDVATLDAWKKEQTKAGTLSPDELVSRGQVMADAIRGSLQTMETERANNESFDLQAMMSMIVEDPMPELPQITGEGRKDNQPSTTNHNKVWLEGVLVYLYVVVFGWQPEHPDIRRYVVSMTETLSGLPRGACIRGMAWPFCIAGCLSPPEDEDKFRAMVKRLGPLEVFGTVKEAAEIQEKVWQCRDHLDESWDVSKCLRILGHRSLLI